MQDYKSLLNIFPKDREEQLRAIERYSMFETFFYRSILWHHTLRVFFIVNELTPIIQKTLPNCDTEKAWVLALVHDDAEMITGDVQLGHKLHMSTNELATVDKEEAEAVATLTEKYPQTVGSYSYRELLLHALNKDCILVSTI